MIKVYLPPCPLIYKTSLGFTQSQLRHGLLTSFLPCTQVLKDSLIPPLLEVGGSDAQLPSLLFWVAGARTELEAQGHRRKCGRLIQSVEPLIPKPKPVPVE